MSKTISINPDLFKFTTNRSRKKRPSDPTTGEIKIRTPKEKTKTLRKNHVLKFIREQQEKNYKKLLEGDSENTKATNIHSNNSISILGPGLDPNNNPNNMDFNSDFDESLKYLMNLTEETDKKAKTASHNQTIKRYPNQDTGSLLFNPGIDVLSQNDVCLEMPTDLMANIVSPLTPLSESPTMTLSQPKHFAPNWGCLKGGNLPTYRSYNTHNQTQRIYPSQMVSPVIPASFVPDTMQSSSDQVNSGPMNVGHNAMIGGAIVDHGFTNNPTNLVNPTSQISLVDMPVQTGGVNRFSEIKQTMQKVAQQKLQQQQNPKKMQYPKQKRTVRRTYKVGKSKTQPKVTVLISNKTLRNNISTKAQLLKQIPIDEVKRFLIKRGFIKVGSSAPNDVLRKMYETSVLMCGEIQNHNPDNLLYNFLHD